MGVVRELKRRVWGLLEEKDLEDLFEELERFDAKRLISPLIGAFCHRDELVRWKAILAFGRAASRVAEHDLEEGRVVVRRLMWMLNEESGGMGWGVAEAMAETLYQSDPLGAEFSHILVSYIRPDGNMLEYPPAQRGVVWGVGRLSQKRRDELLHLNAHRYLLELLRGRDPVVGGLSCWALVQLRPRLPTTPFEVLERLLFDKTRVFFYDGLNFVETTTSQLAKSAIKWFSCAAKREFS